MGGDGHKASCQPWRLVEPSHPGGVKFRWTVSGKPARVGAGPVHLQSKEELPGSGLRACVGPDLGGAEWFLKETYGYSLKRVSEHSLGSQSHLDLNPIHLPPCCDVRQFTQSSLASAPPSVKWGTNSTFQGAERYDRDRVKTQALVRSCCFDSVRCWLVSEPDL